MDRPEAPEIVAPSSGVHIVLPGYYSPANMVRIWPCSPVVGRWRPDGPRTQGLIDPSTSDGRVIFFLPWHGNTIAGTTDEAAEITPNPIPGEKEIDWILSEIRTYLSPEINVRRGDVLSAWSGIRPLVRDPKAKSTESLVRNHLVDVSESGLLTCAGGKWTTYRQMAEETVDEAIRAFGLRPGPVTDAPSVSGSEMVDDGASLDGSCQTHQVRLVGAHGYSKTLFINLIQHFGLETDVARHLIDAYGDRAWTVAALCGPTSQRWPVRGLRISPLYPFVDGEVRYGVRHEYAETAVDVLARRTRLAFLNAQACLEALPRVIDLMADELGWDQARQEAEWRDSVAFLASMGLPKSRLDLSRKDVERGRAGEFDEEEYRLYSRHGRQGKSSNTTSHPLCPFRAGRDVDTLLTGGPAADGPADELLSDSTAYGGSSVEPHQKEKSPLLERESAANK